MLRLLRGQTDPALLERAERLAQSPDVTVADLAAQVLREGRAAPGATPCDVVLVIHRENPLDDSAAGELIDVLKHRGLRVALLPGEPAEKMKTLRAGRGLAVVLGPSGRLPGEAEGFAFDLRVFARQKRPLLGIRLPGSGELSGLPKELSAASWLDLRSGLGDAVLAVERALAPPAVGAVALAIGTVRSEPTPGEAWSEPSTGLRFLWIPGGRFQMGGTRYDAEKPVHWVQLSQFLLGENPVTNGQYGIFLKETGYREPEYWRDRRFSAPEQPVVGVSWGDATKFCEWLAGLAGRAVSLPSEAQWEFAARGMDGREYPWGNEPPDATRACFDLDSEKGQPAPVGSYPGGRGPFGTLDQAGNVWEWCLDRWDEKAYGKRAGGAESVDPVVPADQADENLMRVLRGGGWLYSADNLRAAYRFWSHAWNRYDDIGFRCVLAAAAPASL